MGTSLSWPGMHEGQAEVGSRAPSPPPPSLRSRAGDEEPQGMRDHFVLSIPPPPPGLESGSSKDCREWEGVCVSQELQRMADENRDEVEPEPGP